MEADLDKAEIIKPQSGEMSGDRLLNSHYVNTATSANTQKKVCHFIQVSGPSVQSNIVRYPHSACTHSSFDIIN